MLSQRLQKVSAQIRREISLLIKETLPEELGIVSLNDLEITADFKESKIFVSVLDELKSDEVMIILNKKTKEFQHILGRKLKMKFTPKINFILDKYTDKLTRVDELLEGIKDGS